MAESPAPVRRAPVRDVTEEEARSFRANGWVRLPGLVGGDFADRLRRRALDRLAARRGAPRTGFVDEAFGQDRDIADQDEDFRALATSPPLGRAAARLLTGVERVRLQVTNVLVNDETVFPDPECCDLRRPNARDHMVFGYGIHHCVGAALARLELHLALERLTTRFPGLRLAPDQRIEYRKSLVGRGLPSLLVEW